MSISRVAGVVVVTAGTLAGVLAATPVATADSGTGTTTLTVVGTSDVSDSGLIQNVIQPGFQAAYPQYALNYVGKGTGAAISYAEAGSASALIVHAESLENQFVDPASGPSFSLEPFGRAIFYGDFVLLGPSSDPAGVFASDPHDIVDAFKDVATAGAAGDADFVSRGGTPGTTVEEHGIWQYLTSSGASTVPGLTLCTVSAANGGGYSPSTTGGACPTTGQSYPSWYQVTGLTQGPNVEAGDVCNFPNATKNGSNDCYVLTDRGTFDYLESEGDLHNLKIVTRDNSISAPGGSTLLTNYFHAYAINPAAVPANSNIDTVGATDFLNYLTSPAAQAAAGAYLNGISPSIDSSPPFIADAAPVLTSSAIGPTIKAGHSKTITGNLLNIAPATPRLADQPVSLVKVAHDGVSTNLKTTTDANGQFSFTVTPRQTASYTVETGELTQLENAALSPTFSDELAPASLSLGTTKVIGAPSITKATLNGKTLKVSGKVRPTATEAEGIVALYVEAPGSKSFRLAERGPVEYGKPNYSLSASVARHGLYHFRVSWSVPNQITAGSTDVHSKRVG